MRSYTYFEIEEMRKLLIDIECESIIKSWGPNGMSASSAINNVNFSYVEEKLKTCIMGGVSLKELKLAFLKLGEII